MINFVPVHRRSLRNSRVKILSLHKLGNFPGKTGATVPTIISHSCCVYISKNHHCPTYGSEVIRIQSVACRICDTLYSLFTVIWRLHIEGKLNKEYVFQVEQVKI